MGIYIPNMKMPKKCSKCPIFDYEYGCPLVLDKEQCPLIEIPTPHGRLIDADDSMKHLADDGREAFTKHQVWMFFSEYGAPTILEAEE